MSTATEYLDLEHVLVVLRRRWWVIVLFTVAAGAATFGLAKQQAKQYTATTSVLFPNPELQQQASGLPILPTSPSEDPTIMATNIELLGSQAGVAKATAHAVGVGADVVRSAVSVSQQGQTSVALVSATSTSPRLAARIANTYVDNFIARETSQQKAQVAQALSLVERQIAALSRPQLEGTNGQSLIDRAESLRILARLQNGGAQVVTPASIPTSPSSPKITRDTVLGLLVGLLLGLTLAFLLERLDRRMKTTDDLEEAYGVPLLATVPINRTFAQKQRSEALPQHRPELEVFRMLRAYLRYFNVDREIKTVMITSGAPEDGKTTVAHNLAEAAAEMGSRTLLVDADLRRPDIGQYYGLPQAPGLSELLSGSIELSEAVHRVPIASRMNGTVSEVSLSVLTSGHPPPNPAQLIDSNAMAEFLARVDEHYELIVIDTPPISIVSDPLPLLTKVDGVLLVSRLGKTTRDAASFLRERLAGVNAPLLGVVANSAKDQQAEGYGYGYYGPQDDSRTKRSSTEPQSAR